MTFTYRVEKDESLVKDLQRGGQLLIVLVKLADDLLRLLLRQLDQERLIGLDIEGGDEQMTLIRRDLDDVVALAELLAPLVQDHAVFVEVLCLFDDRLGTLRSS